MNILILGSGGREHALAWKLSQSDRVRKIFVAPGNAGTVALGSNIGINPESFGEIKKVVVAEKIGMVVVGPEAPLVMGIHDFFLLDPVLGRIPVIGPVSAAANLEGSKDFAKAFLNRNNIPTARYKSFEKPTINEAPGFLKTLGPPYVLKADGLAAGKGVVITGTIEEAMEELNRIFSGKFGPAGQKVVIEQFLDGIELSVFIITDGKSYKLLPEAKDYKRIGEGDKGLNTGGMGAVSPVPFADAAFMEKVRSRIVEPTMAGLINEGIEYKGFIFFGLMNVKGDPFVIEYNARLGDPESEVILPRIKSDLFDLLEGVAAGDLAGRTLEIEDGYVSTVMLVSGGYPGEYEKGMEISGLDNTDNCMVFHAGTKLSGEKVITSGGRVVAVSSKGKSLNEALANCYRNAAIISFDKVYYRSDIGFDL